MATAEPVRNKYVGHRYVPLLTGEWDQQASYEGLSIVTFEGGSYTSKKQVPVGINITNAEYWVNTGNYNAQIEYYRQDVAALADLMEEKAPKTDLADTLTLAPNGVNDTTQWNTALSSLADGGQLNLTAGTYFIDEGNLKSNTVIHGRGYPVIKSDTQILAHDSGSSNVTNNLKNVTFEYVVFEAITKTFLEFAHAISLNGASEITFKNCIFKGFRGDGVYLGSGAVAGSERHNENIHFENCIFDGVENQNRNAISVIDVDGLTIERCIFKNVTAPNMPGAIDIEPNSYNFAVIRNIVIRKNKFKNIGGNTGAISLFFPLGQSQLLNPVRNITIANNSIESTKDTQSGIFARQLNTADITTQTAEMNLKIVDNSVSGANNFGIFLTGIRGVEVKDNTFFNNKNGLLLGSTTVGSKLIDLDIKDNKFKKHASGGIAGGVILYGCERVDIENNLFDDVLGSSIVFMDGTSSYVTLDKNTFTSPTGSTVLAVEKKSGHTFTKATNLKKDNVYIGSLPDFFETVNTYQVLATVYDTTRLPDSFKFGEEIAAVNGDAALPSLPKQGILKTIVPTETAGFRKFTTQFFYPANNDATTAADLYFRKASGTLNEWTTWKKVTGI